MRLVSARFTRSFLTGKGGATERVAVNPSALMVRADSENITPHRIWKKMRICHYTETALPKIGGQELVIDALARQQQQLGHDVIVLACHPRLPLRARDSEFPYRVQRHPRFISTRFFVTWYQRWLMQLYRRFPFDVLHCHSVYPTGYVAALAQQRLGVPVVITSHGGDLNEKSRRLQRTELRQRHQQALATADALVAISRFTDDGFRRLGAADAQICRIPNGVDLEPYQRTVPRPADLNPSIQAGEYVLFLGRLKNRKGVDLLLKALAQVPANGKTQVVIAGDGEERPALELLCSKLNLEDRVCFAGSVFAEKKIYLLQNALCTAIPSRSWEAFGLVVLESFAAGTPVVATRLPGIDELIEPEKTGWLVPPENPNELATVLTEVFADKANCQKLGKQALTAVQEYSWRSIAEKHVHLYGDLLKKKVRSKAI